MGAATLEVVLLCLLVITQGQDHDNSHPHSSVMYSSRPLTLDDAPRWPEPKAKFSMFPKDAFREKLERNRRLEEAKSKEELKRDPTLLVNGEVLGKVCSRFPFCRKKVPYPLQLEAAPVNPIVEGDGDTPSALPEYNVI